ncbi:hypothetical protein [Micromonospora sp. NPDC049107]|uniref:hypothetical protein n=1 Tax=unclassified Micromonospora TaxID=2617518 RepID=UPI0033EB794B
MKEFLGWLGLLALLLITALLVFGVVGYVTGGEVADGGMQWLASGFVALLLVWGLGHILDATSRPLNRRRR